MQEMRYQISNYRNFAISLLRYFATSLLVPEKPMHAGMEVLSDPQMK